MTPDILVQDLKKSYGETQAVKGVSLQIGQGEIYGLLGPNGAGKTSLIKMLVTLSQPTGGTASVCGYDISKEADRVRAVIGYVTQEVSVDRTLTAREHLHLYARLYHLPVADIDARVRGVLEMVELSDRADEVAGKYSGGMKKRLDLACGLVHRPRVLFLDEPTLGLDIQTRHRLWEYIRRLKAEGMTMILTTHYLDEADQLCDRIGIIDHGRMVVEDTPMKLKAGLGGDAISLQWNASQGEGRAQEALSRVEGCTGAKWGVNEATLYVANGDRVLPKVLDAARLANLEIASVSMSRPTMDEVFLKYTGRRLREL